MQSRNQKEGRYAGYAWKRHARTHAKHYSDLPNHDAALTELQARMRAKLRGVLASKTKMLADNLAFAKVPMRF